MSVLFRSCKHHVCSIPAFLEQELRAHLTWGALRQDKLVRIAKKLKKNNVAVDVVAFGSEGEDANTEKLEAFREAVNSGDNSHLVTVPAGTVLSDMLFSSPIFQVAHATAMFLQAAQEGHLLYLCRCRAPAESSKAL